MIRVGLIGFGYWGPNLLRNLLQNSYFQVMSVADLNQERLNVIKEVNPLIQLTIDADDILNDPNIDAVIIASPVLTHFSFALKALKNKKHVLIEKPMCSAQHECIELIEVAKENSLTLMVDHTFIWNASVQKIYEIYNSGELGKLCYIDSVRINLGLFQQDVNVLWDLGPHDFSILNYILKQHPIHIDATGNAHLNPNMPDIVYLTLYYPTNVIVHLTLSWMSPVKVRRFAVGGTSKMLVWDDLNSEEKIKIYDSGISYQKNETRSIIIPEYRIGNIFSPRIYSTEALTGVISHFARVIKNLEDSLMDGNEGLRVVSMLEEAQYALNKNLREVDIKRQTHDVHDILS